MAHEAGFSKFVVESDSQSLVQALNGESNSFAPFGNVVQVARSLVTHLGMAGLCACV